MIPKSRFIFLTICICIWYSHLNSKAIEKTNGLFVYLRPIYGRREGSIGTIIYFSSWFLISFFFFLRGVWGEMTRRYWNINLEEMLEAGVHFGHGTRKWNPKMAPYISAKRKGIHITNLTKTARFLSEACDLVFDAASRGKQFLIVGTKKKAADSVAWAAIKARCHCVNKKWLGGMLTNWSTTETRLHKFRDLRMEQKTGRLDRLPKRDAAVVKRQLSRLQTYLGGIKYMTGLPDIVIIIDQHEEYTALRECITLGIPTVCLIDTNCDPHLADISIPANDDAISSIRLILNKLVFAISEGRSSYIRNP